MENVKDPEGAGARFSPGRVAQEVRSQLPRHPLLRPSTQHCGIDLGRRLSGPGLQGPRMGTSVQMTEDPSHPSLAGMNRERGHSADRTRRGKHRFGLQG